MTNSYRFFITYNELYKIMTSSELNAAYAERKRVQDLQIKTPTDSTLKQQLQVNDAKIDKLEQTEKVGKYQA